VLVDWEGFEAVIFTGLESVIKVFWEYVTRHRNETPKTSLFIKNAVPQPKEKEERNG
jgi:hypothetical protein